MVLLPEEKTSAGSNGLVSFTCGTDSQGNMFLLDKLLTTKYPLGVILMELSCQLGRRQAAMRANWIPRLQNEESDALTNWDFRHFTMANRVEVNLDDLPFIVLRDLFDVGEAYVVEREALKTAEKKRKASSGHTEKVRKKKVSETLRVKNPW